MPNNFYLNLKTFSDPAGVADLDNYALVPDDWSVVITDVRGSTEAIHSGRYKDINIIGASCIAAVLNALPGVGIPYVFGGDGATLLVPPEALTVVKETLLVVKQMTKDQFQLDLRIGAAPVSEVHGHGAQVFVAKYAVAPEVSLAVFSGGGVSVAESLIKKKDSNYLWNGQSQRPANFSGLECRWETLKSRKGYIVSAIIKANGPNLAFTKIIYKELIREINEIVGGHGNLNVSSQQNLKTQVSLAGLRGEQKVQTYHDRLLTKIGYLFKIWLGSLLGRIFFRFKLKVAGVDWGRYKSEVIQNTDFWKYDDALRFVVDMTMEHKVELENLLLKYSNLGKISYGLHLSDSALMTCLVFDRGGNHVHFIDGNDGGYAFAAKALKKKIL